MTNIKKTKKLKKSIDLMFGIWYISITLPKKGIKINTKSTKMQKM